MIAVVERDACIGCGACPSICPEVFELDEEGIAVAVKEQVPDEFEDSAQEAADSCPTEAIVIS